MPFRVFVHRRRRFNVSRRVYVGVGDMDLLAAVWALCLQALVGAMCSPGAHTFGVKVVATGETYHVISCHQVFHANRAC